MKGNALKLRKGFVLGMALLFVAATGTLLLATHLWAVEGDQCYFEDGTHVGWFQALGDFTMASAEELESLVGEAQLDSSGRTVTPIRILSMVGRGRATGIGETVYWLDTSRPVASGLRSKLRGHEFPAVHQMGFHLFLTTEALPGKVFRSMNPAIMVNDNATSFPPRVGTRYRLQNVVAFEDVEEPGVVAARILSNHNQYAGSRRPDLGGRREN